MTITLEQLCLVLEKYVNYLIVAVLTGDMHACDTIRPTRGIDVHNMRVARL